MIEREPPIDLGLSAQQARVNCLILVAILYLERLKTKGLVECQLPITPKGREVAQHLLAGGFLPTDVELDATGRYMAKQNGLPKEQVENFLVLLKGERDGLLDKH